MQAERSALVSGQAVLWSVGRETFMEAPSAIWRGTHVGCVHVICAVVLYLWRPQGSALCLLLCSSARSEENESGVTTDHRLYRVTHSECVYSIVDCPISLG